MHQAVKEYKITIKKYNRQIPMKGSLIVGLDAVHTAPECTLGSHMRSLAARAPDVYYWLSYLKINQYNDKKEEAGGTQPFPSLKMSHFIAPIVVS